MKRSLEPGQGSSTTADPKRKRSGKIELESSFPLEQGKIYFTPIGGITSPLVCSEGAMSFSDIIDLTRPTNSIHFNFMIDFEWMISCYPPSIRSNPITLVVGDSDTKSLRQDAKNHPNITVHPARLPIPYGTHHTKLSILENETNLHVIISTANLVTGDWEFKTQQFYHAVGSRRLEMAEDSGFRADLLEYLKFYGKNLEPWIEIIKKFDFSDVKDRLIFSVPGYHKNQDIKKYGHPRMRQLLQNITTPSESTSKLRPLYIAQCSSIGSLGKTPATWFRGEFLKAMEGGTPAVPSRLFLIYPTVENVRTSCEGYEGGGSLPYRGETHIRQPWLNDAFCQWRSDTNNRTKAMPHVKTYVKIVDQQPIWQVLTSANLSKAAWGEYQKNNTQLCIRSYEMGVLITDPSRIKLPYDYPIVKYKEGDKPWITDAKHEKPDIFGRKWIV